MRRHAAVTVTGSCCSAQVCLCSFLNQRGAKPCRAGEGGPPPPPQEPGFLPQHMWTRMHALTALPITNPSGT